MEYPKVPTGIGIAACVVRNNKMLLGRRSTDPCKGTWCTIGGFVDPKETLEMAVRREVQEETGCKVIKCKYFFSIIEDYANRQILTVAFLCEIEGEPQPSDEMTEFQWVSREIPLTTNFSTPKVALKKYFSSSKQNP